MRGLTKLPDVFKDERVQRDTGYFWLRLRKESGSPGTRRTGKHRSGHPFSIPDETLGQMLAKTNPIRTKRIEALYYCLRTLRRALRNRRKRGGMYIMAQGRFISQRHLKKC